MAEDSKEEEHDAGWVHPAPWQKKVCFPGVLAATMRTRIADLERPNFSQYIVELVCFDLRIRRKHALTGPIAHLPLKIQDAVDREIARNYMSLEEQRKRGPVVSGDFIRRIIRREETPWCAPAPTQGLKTVEKDTVYFPGLHEEAILQRVKENGFRNVSQYVTSVMRYDLILLGQHRYFRQGDTTPDMLPGLDRGTLREFLANRQPRTLADRIVEEFHGRKMTREECDAELERVSGMLTERALQNAKKFRT